MQRRRRRQALLDNGIVRHWEDGKGDVLFASFYAKKNNRSDWADECDNESTSISVTEFQGTRPLQNDLPPSEIASLQNRPDTQMFLRPFMGKTTSVVPIDVRMDARTQNHLLLGTSYNGKNYSIGPSTQTANLFPSPILLSGRVEQNIRGQVGAENIILIDQGASGRYVPGVIVALSSVGGTRNNNELDAVGYIFDFIEKLNDQRAKNTKEYRTFQAQIGRVRTARAPRLVFQRPNANLIVVPQPANVVVGPIGAVGLTPSTPVRDRQEQVYTSPVSVERRRFLTPGDFDHAYDSDDGSSSPVQLQLNQERQLQNTYDFAWREFVARIRANLDKPSDSRQSFFDGKNIDKLSFVEQLYGSIDPDEIGNTFNMQARTISGIMDNIPLWNDNTVGGFIGSQYQTTAKRGDMTKTDAVEKWREFMILRSAGKMMPSWITTQGSDQNGGSVLYNDVYFSFGYQWVDDNASRAYNQNYLTHYFGRNEQYPYGLPYVVPLADGDNKSSGSTASNYSIADLAMSLLGDNNWNVLLGQDPFLNRTTKIVLSLGLVVDSGKPDNVFFDDLVVGEAARGSQIVISNANINSYTDVAVSKFIEHGSHAALYKLAERITNQDNPPLAQALSTYAVLAEKWQDKGDADVAPIFSVVLTATLVSDIEPKSLSLTSRNE